MVRRRETLASASEMLVAACEWRGFYEVRAHALDQVGAGRVREGLRAVEHQLVAPHVLDALLVHRNPRGVSARATKPTRYGHF
jgi:hypothetical protein